jgi:hypothetical protein
MRSISSDNRGATVQIGFVLVFSIVVIAFTLTQAHLVPQWNSEVEFSHNEKVQNDLQQLSSTIDQAGATNSPSEEVVRVGATYPNRDFFVSLPQPNGRLTTSEQYTVSIDNMTAVRRSEQDYLNGSLQEFKTRNIEYQPDYNHYKNSPKTVIGIGSNYNVFENTALINTEQSLISGEQISLTTVEGDLTKTGQVTKKVSVIPESAPATTKTVKSEDGPITIRFPTEINLEEWSSELEQQRTENRGRVTSISKSSGVLTIKLEQGEVYSLRVAHVKVGDGDSSPDTNKIENEYVVKTEGGRATIRKGSVTNVVTKVYDGYGNPKSGVEVNATTDEGTFSNGRSEIKRITSSDGEITFVYRHDGVSADEVNIDVSSSNDPTDNFSKSRPSDARYTLYVSGSGLNATVESAEHVQRGGGPKNEVAVSWSASSNNGLQSGTLYLRDEEGNVVEQNAINPSGQYDTGTEEFKNIGEVPSNWTVEIVVADNSGTQDRDTRDVT